MKDEWIPPDGYINWFSDHWRMWNGSEWVPCDGASGTEDLRGVEPPTGMLLRYHQSAAGRAVKAGESK